MMQEQQKPKEIERSRIAYIPTGFAVFCTIYFYATTFFLIGMIALVTATVGRIALIPMLPFLLLLAPCLWLYGHWVRLSQHKIPVYEISGDGVIDRASFPHSTVTLPFQNISQMKTIHWGGFTGLSFTLKDKEAFYASLGRRHRFLARVNALFYGTPYVLWQAWSDVPLAQMQYEVEKELK